MSAEANWDGHEFDPNGALSLPERIVHAAETAIEDAADSRYRELSGATSVEGLLIDFARESASAVIEVLAGDMVANGGEGHAVQLRMLAQAVRDVPALKAV
jgi:hypothetical protein